MAQNNFIQRQFIGTPWALDTAAGDIYTEVVLHPMIVHAVDVVYTEATDAAIAQQGIVSFDTIEAINEAARTERGTYTSELSKAVGFSASLGISKRVLDVGDTMIFEAKQAMTGGEAGTVQLVMYYELIPDGTV